jgi:cytochrome b561
MLRNRAHGYGSITIILHWLIALLFIGQLVGGNVMTRLEDKRLAFNLIQWHKSFGFLLLALVLLRILWRLANRAPRYPETMPVWEQRAAHVSHGLLYMLQLALPLTGWIVVSVSVLAIPTFAFYLVIIPNLPLAAAAGTEHLFMRMHTWLGYAAAGLLALHIAAALRHHFVLKDGLMRRMLRPVTKA